MENPTAQKDSSTVMNPVRRAGLFILLFGLGLLFGAYPPIRKTRSSSG